MPDTTRKDHQVDRLIAIRLRYCINTYLEDHSLTAPAAIGAAVGLPAAAAVSLLTRRHGAGWRAIPVELGPW